MRSRIGVAGVDGEEGRDGLVDELEHFEVSVDGSLVEGGLLCVGEVGGDGDDDSLDRVAEVVAGRLCQTAEVTGGDFANADGAWLGLVLVLDGEGDSLVAVDGVSRGVACGGVYRLEAASADTYISLPFLALFLFLSFRYKKVRQHLHGFTHSLPIKSRKYATVFFALRTSCDLAWFPTNSSPPTYARAEGI